VETALVADIPVLFARPETTKAGGRLALWTHFLGGSKEAMVPFLLRLAEAEPLDQLMTRAFGQFRRNVWPILGHTTLDAMRVLDWRSTETVIEQGEPTAYGQWMFDHLDPMTHLGSFARAPAITFQLGGNDLHINAENAVRFKAALAGAYPDAATEVHIRVHPGLDHLGAGRDRGIEDACLDWLLR
jgi:hypothetical protein